MTTLSLCYSDVLTDEAILKVAWLVVPFAIVITFIGSLFVLSVKKLKLSDPYAKAILIIGKSSFSIFTWSMIVDTKYSFEDNFSCKILAHELAYLAKRMVHFFVHHVVWTLEGSDTRLC